MTVSIIIPLHNKAAYIGTTLRSVKMQTMQDWEAIVVENHSTDNGPGIVDEFSGEDSRIKLLRAPHDISGPGAARNYGYQSIKGEWILFLDADDLLSPAHLEDLLKIAISENSDIAVSNWLEFSDKAFNVEPSQGDQSRMRKKHPSGLHPGRFSLEESAIAYAPWAIHCALVRKDRFKGHLNWIEELDSFPSEDTAFWFRLVLGKKVAYSNKFSAIYRRGSNNFRDQFHDLDKWLTATTRVTKANLDYLEENKIKPNSKQFEVLMRMWENIGLRAIKKKETEFFDKAAEMARKHMNQCIRSGGLDSMGIFVRRVVGSRNYIRLNALLNKTND